ncbi:MAG: 5'-3' exonuclease H3TH domain-containing protein [Candidatus Colwellbacteria bacterium]|nr:5'-3' exonuclease H3TH domain-containing protein [Candidatus Colwellbacteria bacterium]
MKDTLLLIDANSIIHRAYHALPPLTAPNGEPTGALYGLASVLIRLFKEKHPRYAAAAFDLPEPTFRKQKFSGYKALRPPTPDDLIPQLEASKDLISRFGIKVLGVPGYEADDIIATLAQRFSGQVGQVVILSGDLDLLQAVDGDQVVAEIPQKGISTAVIYNEQGVLDRLGIRPNQVPDYKGLVGDKSDNIPGVSGVGPKTAVTLIKTYGTIENIYQKIQLLEKESPILADKLMRNKETALLSKELATALRDAPSPKGLEELAVGADLYQTSLYRYLEGFGFKTLVQRIEQESEPPKRKMGKLF